MSSLNQVTIMGRLGQDPELKNANGIAICNFSVATSKKWKNESGEKQEKTEWHSIVAFRKTAEIASKYLAKGSPVLIVGELQTRSWEDKETGVKKYRTEIIAHNLQFISDGKKQENSNEPESEYPPQPNTETGEIPF